MRLFELRLAGAGPAPEEAPSVPDGDAKTVAPRERGARPQRAEAPNAKGAQSSAARPASAPPIPWRVRGHARPLRPHAASAARDEDALDEEATRPPKVTRGPARSADVTAANAGSGLREEPWSRKIKDLTVLFADLQGSTPLFEQRGDGPAMELVVRYHRAVRDAVASHTGRVVKTMGDGVMAVFEHPRPAVLAGMEIHEALLRERRSPGLWLPARIGIHRGPMIASELAPGQIDYLGHTVNVASRIQSAAEPGQLALSDAVAEATGVRSLLSSRDVSTELRTVKGVQNPLRLHRIGFLDEVTEPHGLF